MSCKATHNYNTLFEGIDIASRMRGSCPSFASTPFDHRGNLGAYTAAVWSETTRDREVLSYLEQPAFYVGVHPPSARALLFRGAGTGSHSVQVTRRWMRIGDEDVARMGSPRRCCACLLLC